jgi:hypothetical protein
VRAEGLEPPQLSSLEPKSSASTNSATPADCIISGRDAAGGGLITWAHASAAKKRPSPNLLRSTRASWTYPAESGPHRSMPDRTFGLDRRELLAALGATAVGQCPPGLASARRRPSVTLEAKAAVIAPGQNQPEIPIWALQSSPPDPLLRFGKAMSWKSPFRTVCRYGPCRTGAGLMV